MLKRVPGLPQVLDGLLLTAALLTNRGILRALHVIERTATAWPGVSVHPHRFGGIQFDKDSHEIGHIHGNGIVDIPFDRPSRDDLIRRGLALPHHSFPDSGWVSLPLREDADAARALDLLRLSYERRQRV